jgi:hypothetical protein
MTDTIQVNVKSMNGMVFNKKLKLTDKCEDLIKATAASSGHDAKAIRLIHVGKDISESQEKTIEELGIENGSTMFLVLRLVGGQPIMAK